MKYITRALLLFLSLFSISHAVGDPFEDVKNGDIEAVRAWVTSDVYDPNSRDHHHRTLLMHAAYKSHEEMVQLLLDNRVDPNAVDDQEMSALLWLAQSKYGEEQQRLKIAQRLLSAGANSNHQDRDTGTPLYFACKKGEADLVDLLCRHKGRTDLLTKGLSPLYVAALYGRTLVIEVLLQHRAQVNFMEERHCITPLLIALYQGWEDAAISLLLAGAAPNLTRHDGISPLKIAIHMGEDLATTHLLARGASISHRQDGLTFFEYSINHYLATAEGLRVAFEKEAHEQEITQINQLYRRRTSIVEQLWNAHQAARTHQPLQEKHGLFLARKRIVETFQDQNRAAFQQLISTNHHLDYFYNGLMVHLEGQHRRYQDLHLGLRKEDRNLFQGVVGLLNTVETVGGAMRNYHGIGDDIIEGIGGFIGEAARYFGPARTILNFANMALNKYYNYKERTPRQSVAFFLANPEERPRHITQLARTLTHIYLPQLTALSQAGWQKKKLMDALDKLHQYIINTIFGYMRTHQAEGEFIPTMVHALTFYEVSPNTNVLGEINGLPWTDKGFFRTGMHFASAGIRCIIQGDRWGDPEVYGYRYMLLEEHEELQQRIQHEGLQPNTTGIYEILSPYSPLEKKCVLL